MYSSIVNGVERAIQTFHMENDPTSDQLRANLNLPIPQPTPIVHFKSESISPWDAFHTHLPHPHQDQAAQQLTNGQDMNGQVKNPAIVWVRLWILIFFFKTLPSLPFSLVLFYFNRLVRLVMHALFTRPICFS